METSIVLKGTGWDTLRTLRHSTITTCFSHCLKEASDKKTVIHISWFVMRKAEELDRDIMASLRLLAVLDSKGGDSCFVTRTDLFSPTSET